MQIVKLIETYKNQLNPVIFEAIKKGYLLCCSGQSIYDPYQHSDSLIEGISDFSRLHTANQYITKISQILGEVSNSFRSGKLRYIGSDYVCDITPDSIDIILGKTAPTLIISTNLKGGESLFRVDKVTNDPFIICKMKNLETYPHIYKLISEHKDVSTQDFHMFIPSDLKELLAHEFSHFLDSEFGIAFTNNNKKQKNKNAQLAELISKSKPKLQMLSTEISQLKAEIDYINSDDEITARIVQLIQSISDLLISDFDKNSWILDDYKRFQTMADALFEKELITENKQRKINRRLYYIWKTLSDLRAAFKLGYPGFQKELENTINNNIILPPNAISEALEQIHDGKFESIDPDIKSLVLTFMKNSPLEIDREIAISLKK
jgi:hypothetical protein